MGKGSKELKQKASNAEKLANEWMSTISKKKPYGAPETLVKFINFFRSNNLSWNKIGLTDVKDQMIQAKEHLLKKRILDEKFLLKNKYKTIFVKAREHVS